MTRMRTHCATRWAKADAGRPLHDRSTSRSLLHEVSAAAMCWQPRSPILFMPSHSASRLAQAGREVAMASAAPVPMELEDRLTRLSLGQLARAGAMAAAPSSRRAFDERLSTSRLRHRGRLTRRSAAPSGPRPLSERSRAAREAMRGRRGGSACESSCARVMLSCSVSTRGQAPMALRRAMAPSLGRRAWLRHMSRSAGARGSAAQRCTRPDSHGQLRDRSRPVRRSHLGSAEARPGRGHAWRDAGPAYTRPGQRMLHTATRSTPVKRARRRSTGEPGKTCSVRMRDERMRMNSLHTTMWSRTTRMSRKL
mmetsp:Transcript_1455/g.4613  ORF Transcript_1455/g.4613 Transcript_1455/m.4613 type:complete len:310 (-) Transcript_1455:310-1239(-)